MVMITMNLMIGCAARHSSFTTSPTRDETIQQAKRFYNNHEYYSARRSVQQVLETNPKDGEATQIMANVLEKEIERQKENLLPQAVEEMGKEDKQNQIKTWLERSRTLFAAKQYDLALFAAEKVFLYDNENTAASELIDKIKGQALKDGKAETLFVSKMYEEEISDRLERYRQQAEELVDQGQLGQAQFTLEKILLLEPEDPKARGLLQKILVQKEKRDLSL